MKTNAHQLIDELMAMTNRHLSQCREWKNLGTAQLNARPRPEAWSALECMEHLNRYLNFYLPEIARRIGQAPPSGSKVFVSGWLGNYFAMSMLPGEKLNPMKTFSAMNPSGSALGPDAVVRFEEGLTTLLGLLEKARQVDLGRTRTSITLTRWITLRLGDTLRFVIYHHTPHAAGCAGSRS